MSLSGLCFAITGTLSVGRSEFEGLITSNGGKVAKSVTNSCTHLVSSITGTKKCEDAEAKGVQVVDEAWVRARAGGAAPTATAAEAPPLKKAKVTNTPAAAVAPPKSSGEGHITVWFQLEGKRAARVTVPRECIIDDFKSAVREKCAPILDAVAVMDLCVFNGDDACDEDALVESYLANNSASAPLSVRVLAEEEVQSKPPSAPAAKAKAKAAAPAPAAGAAAGGSSATAGNAAVVAYLECQEGSSDKFYEMSRDGNEVHTRYGRRGTPGVTQVKSFGSAGEAETFIKKTTAEKRKKGYHDVAVSSAASVGAPSGVAQAAAAPAPSVNTAPAAVAEEAKAEAGGALDGFTIAITGTLSVGRSDFEKLITSNGGKVAKSVTNSCTHLVSSSFGTKKCEDAEAKGVRVVDEAWLRARIAGAADDAADATPGSFEPSGAFVKEMLGLDGERPYEEFSRKLVGRKVYRIDDGVRTQSDCKITKFKTKDGEGVITITDFLEDDEHECTEDDFFDEWQLYPTGGELNLFNKHMSRKITEGVWESVASVELMSKTNELVDEFAAKEPADLHPGTNGIVRDHVHPSLYPLLLTEGTDTSKRNFWGRRHEDSKFQWLPTEFTIDEDGKATVASDINNLDVDKYPQLRDTLAEIFTTMIPGFEKVWSYAKMIRAGVNEEDDEEGAEYDSFADEYPALEPISFRGSNLQAVVKIADYTFTPGAEFDGVWHYEGMAHEDIVMTGLFYPRSDEALGGSLEFKRIFTNVEVKEIFFGVPQDRCGWLEEYISDGFCPLGKTETETGKLLVFPNSHAHHVMKMKNNTSETITRRLIVFFVINPESRIPSSRDHPPMPRQISLEEALDNRLELMQERKYAKQKLNPRVIELCEH